MLSDRKGMNNAVNRSSLLLPASDGTTIGEISEMIDIAQNKSLRTYYSNLARTKSSASMIQGILAFLVHPLRATTAVLFIPRLGLGSLRENGRGLPIMDIRVDIGVKRRPYSFIISFLTCIDFFVLVYLGQETACH